jgi:uncharacterized OB-fold protein
MSAIPETAADVIEPAPPRPTPDIDSERYWAAARDGRFELCRCTSCRRWLQPPLERCRHCGGPTAFEPASGVGEIYSFIVIRHPSVPAFARHLPYVVALVELTEGVRLPGRMVGIEPDAVRIGQRVHGEFDTLPGADQPAYVFRPTGGPSASRRP